MSKDSLKFFQAYIREMIEVGGQNFPRTISTKLGAKLGKLYKRRGLANSLVAGIKHLYVALKASPTIKKIDELIYEIYIKFPKKIGQNFCPIGGDYNPSSAALFQENICIPYTLGFLNEIAPNLKFKPTIKQCIVADNVKTCHYILKTEEK